MLINAGIRRTLFLALGAGTGPFVMLLATPLLARMFTPSDFGHLALFLSAAGILVVISCLRYELLISVVADEYIPGAVWLAIISSILLALLMMLLISLHLHQMWLPQLGILGDAIWGLPIFAMCGGLVLIALQLSLRTGNFGINAILRSGQTSLFVILILSCRDLGLIFASLLSGLVLGSILMAYFVYRVPLNNLRNLGSVAWKHKQYPIISMPTSLVDAMATSTPVFLIGLNYGADVTGNYIQIQKLVGAPLVLAAVVSGQLFLKKSGELYRDNRSSENLLWAHIKILTLVAALIFILLSIGGEYVLGLLLGASWRVDTMYLLLVSTPYLFRLIVSPVSYVFITHDNIAILGRWQFSYFTSILLVLYYSSINMSFESFLCALVFHEAIWYSIYLYLANKTSKKLRNLNV